jgi:hypothetical protein
LIKFLKILLKIFYPYVAVAIIVCPFKKDWEGEGRAFSLLLPYRIVVKRERSTRGIK